MVQSEGRLLHHLFMDPLAVDSSTIAPKSNGSFIEAQGFDNRLYWTAIESKVTIMTMSSVGLRNPSNIVPVQDVNVC